MIKKNKWQLILSSLVILLPGMVSLLTGTNAPAGSAAYWGKEGITGGGLGLAGAGALLSVVLLALHWLCILITVRDHKKTEMNSKVFSLTVWIFPSLSLFINVMAYAIAQNQQFNPLVYLCVLMGVMFIVIGNYLPKCRQSRTMGIKVVWTLNNEENWLATHRVAGKVSVICGVVVLLCSLLPTWAGLAAVIVSALAVGVIPTIYSYRYYRKQLAEGKAQPVASNPKDKRNTVIALCVTAAALAIAAVATLIGDVQVDFAQESFTVKAIGWSDLTVAYDAIDEIEYRDTDDAGSRVMGYGGLKVLSGAFRNEEFGQYTRYSYVNAGACVVITVDGNVLVVSGKDAQSTKEIYETIQSHME